MSQPRSACAVVILPRDRWSRYVRRIIDQTGALRIDDVPAPLPLPLPPAATSFVDDLAVTVVPRSVVRAGGF
jgi:hypothetical protein